jgi:hypothetical protein
MQGIQRSFMPVRAASALLLFCAVAACSSRDPISTAQGSQFTLKSIDDHELPYQISQSADSSTKVVVTDLVLSVLEDATWRTSGHERVTTNGVEADRVVHGSGTFVAHDTSATFRNAQGDIVYEGAFIDTPPKFIITDSLAHVYLFCGTAVDLTLCQLPQPAASAREN